jgi:hypothetical protein
MASDGKIIWNTISCEAEKNDAETASNSFK